MSVNRFKNGNLVESESLFNAQFCAQFTLPSCPDTSLFQLRENYEIKYVK